jgi:mannose-6-phosphate isomerase-like protein (cupin superfamily)
MSAPVSIAGAEHYTWGEACDGWHLVRDTSLSVIEERMPPGTEEQRHLHHRSRQFFYVLAGELTMELAGLHHQLIAGTGLEILPGRPHQAINNSGEDVRFLVISQPPSHGDRQPA